MPSPIIVFRILATALRVIVRRAIRGRGHPQWTLGTEIMRTFMLGESSRYAQLDALGQRAANERMAFDTPALRATKRTEVVANGMRSFWIEPRDGVGANTPVVFYIHGGGYIFGSTRTHGDVMARIALRTRAKVFAIEYRLAPEHSCPAPIDDALAAYRWLLASGVDAANVVVAGDSAGGAIAVAVMVALRDAGESLPRSAVLLSPWVDLAHPGESMSSNEPYDWGTKSMLDQWASWYAAKLPLDDPRVSPTHARLEGLPPVFVQYGGGELLASDVDAFVAKLRVAGVDVTTNRVDGMFHNFVFFEPQVPEAAPGMDAIRDFVLRTTS